MDTITVALNGVTGRMGYRQHLVRSILALREEGGLKFEDGQRVAVEPVLIGRNEDKLRDIACRHDIKQWSTNLDSVLADPDVGVYFDAQRTSARAPALAAALAAGKHIYAEKPVATTADQAVELARQAAEADVVAGVVHDKLYLPGLRKLARLVDSGFFGKILSVRGEFGYWVFEGDWQVPQRPSWNYRVEDGGGISVDMLCHWSYVLENLFGAVRSVSATAATHIPTRWDETGGQYQVTADDAVYAIFDLDGGIVAQINSSWCVRVHRDELVEFQVDGTEGSAVAGLRGCVTQHRVNTPKPVWNPDLPSTERFRAGWSEVPDNEEFGNGFKAQWEQFLRDVLAGRPHAYGVLSGARGIRLAQAGLESSQQRRWIDLPELMA